MPSWYVLCSEALQELLERAHAGEDPELLLIELYANSDVDKSTGLRADAVLN